MSFKPLVCLMCCAAAHAGSGSGAVTFTGGVAAPTCTSSVNGSASPDGAVVLPPISGSLSSRGARSGETRFAITLTGCGAPVGLRANAHFYSPVHAGGDGRLVKASGSGAGWDYELLPAIGNKPLVLARSNAPQTQGGRNAGEDVNGTDATLRYRVRYHRRAEPLRSGSIHTAAIYVVEYS